MRQPIDVIVAKSDVEWRHIPTGVRFLIVWASPREVIAISAKSAWRGRAVEFVREFEAIAKS